MTIWTMTIDICDFVNNIQNTGLFFYILKRTKSFEIMFVESLEPRLRVEGRIRTLVYNGLLFT